MYKFFCLALLLMLAVSCAPAAPTATATPVPKTEEPLIPTATSSPMPTVTTSPTAHATPTLSPELNSLRIVFTNAGQLWLWENGTARPLTSSDEPGRATISDDGQLIAFRKQGLSLIQSDGSNERVLVSREDLASMEPKDPGVLLAEFEWIPGSHKLFFNTVLNSDYGLSFTDDLYVADADAMQFRSLRLPREGGKILIAPDNQHVAMTSPSQISVMRLDGSDYRVLMNYHVPYPSEMAFYAKASWSDDSQSLIVPIPPEDFFYGTTLPTIVWRLPIDGAAPIVEAELPPGESGVDQRIWSPEREHFAFWVEQNYYLDTDSANDNPLTEPGAQRNEFGWVDETHFIYLGNCDLRLGTIGGASIQIGELGGTDGRCFTVYDFSK